jgi:hypothetical protein
MHLVMQILQYQMYFLDLKDWTVKFGCMFCKNRICITKRSYYVRECKKVINSTSEQSPNTSVIRNGFFALANDKLKLVTLNCDCDRVKVCAAIICGLHLVNVFLLFTTLILRTSNGRIPQVFPRYTVCKACLQVTGLTRGVETQIWRKPKTPFETCNFAFADSNLKPSISYQR